MLRVSRADEHDMLPRVAIALALALSLSSVAFAKPPESKPGKPDHASTPPKPDTPAKPATPKGPPFVPPGQAVTPPGPPLTPPGQLLAGHGRDAAPQVDPAHTELGETVGALPTGGTVLVKTPGSDAFTPLAAGAPVPVGTTVDAREGAVEIGSAAPGAVEQHAVMGGAVFRVDQAADGAGVTDIVLTGDTSACKATTARRSSRRPIARAAGARRKSKPVRSIWASGKGKFRTHGSNAVASVRGTHWIVADQCDSTTVKVVEGVVDVQDLITGKTVAVRAGQRHVARVRSR